jgi:hypothetical protein
MVEDHDGSGKRPSGAGVFANSIGFSAMRAWSTYSAGQVYDQQNQQDGSDDSQSSASSPSGVPVIAAASSEQEHQKNN